MLDKLEKRVAWAIKIIASEPELDKGIPDVALSKLLGTNKNTLAKYRQGKGLLKGEVIDNLVLHYDFNPMWLFRGQGEPFPGARAKYEDVCGPEESAPVAMPLTQALGIKTQSHHVQEFSIAEDLTLAAKVLESKTHYATALHLNIRSFAGAVNDSSTLNSVLSRLEDLEGRLDKLQSENNTLREEVKTLRGNPGGSPPIALGMDHVAPTGTENQAT